MAYEAGVAYLSVLPSFRGGARSIADQMAGPMRGAGQQGASAYGAGMTEGRGRGGFVAAGAKAGGLFVAAFAAVGLAEVARGVQTYLSDAVSSASDLAETQSKVREIFGESSAELLEWSRTAADTLGQSQQTALDGAATFGIFARSAGLAGREAAGFSTEMVTLAADLASFNNTSPEEAIEAIGAALRGEAEPIRRYGVLLDDATLKQRAVTLGIYDGTGALTQQQRVMAAQSEILAQTSTQQGDFARTSDGLANSQRRVQAEMENLQTEIGTALLPIARDLFAVFADVGVPLLKELGAWFVENQEEIKALTLQFIDLALRGTGALLTIMRVCLQFQSTVWGVTANVITWWLGMADTILAAAVKAFGWVPGVGERLQDAQADFRSFKDGAERNLAAVKTGSDRMAAGILAGERAVGDLSAAVRGIDGYTANVNVRLNLPRYSESDIPGTAAWYASRGIPMAQARAHGGPIVAGRPYLVGERGPELIVPNTSGTVIPNDQLGGDDVRTVRIARESVRELGATMLDGATVVSHGAVADRARAQKLAGLR